MRRRAYALLAVVAIVLHGPAVSSSTDEPTSPEARWAAITTLAETSYDEWLGPSRSSKRHLSPLDVRGSMAIEARVAYLLARTRLEQVSDSDVAQGLAWYLQSRVVEQAFNQRYRSPGYRHYAACFLGCAISVTLPALTVSRWGDGAGRPEFLRQSSSREWPSLDRPDFIGNRAFAMSLAFASLERELGWPALQGALNVVARAADRSDVIATLEDATARSLKPVFEAANGARTDFLIRAVSESSTDICVPPACYRTEVAIAGPAQTPFPFVVRIDFADGTNTSTIWAGSNDAIVFESAAPFTRIQLDPDRHWLLDTNFTNNDYVKDRTTNVPVTKWLARWVVWLQDATLTYTFFV